MAVCSIDYYTHGWLGTMHTCTHAHTHTHKHTHTHTTTLRYSTLPTATYFTQTNKIHPRGKFTFRLKRVKYSHPIRCGITLNGVVNL